VTDTVDKVIIQSETQGVQQSTDQLNQLGKSMDGVTVASQNVEKSTGTVDGKFAALERRFSTTAGQAAQLAKIQKTVNDAVGANPELQNRANAVLAAAEARYGGVIAAEKALGEAHTGLSAQGQALFHSIRSVGEQLALGVSPAQALTGQINHLTFAASGEGGLAGAFSQVKNLVGGGVAAIASAITPITATIAGTVALTAAAAALALQYDKVQVSAQRALAGAGQRTGTTVSDLNTFTQQNSGLSGTGLSAKEARALGEDFTKTGDIVISRLHGMSEAVVGFANQTGKSIDEARKDFVAFAVDPKKGLDELSQTYGSFDAATRKAVDALVLADDKTGAFQVIIDSLGEKSKAAAENMGFFEKAARGIVNVLSTETVKPSGLEQQIEATKAKLNGAIEGAAAGGPSALAAEYIKKLTDELIVLQNAAEKVSTQKAAAEINKLSTEADAATRAIIPQIAQIEQLQAKLEQLNRAKQAGYGADVDNAATVAIQNQLAVLRESQAEAARYNQRVQEISQAWGNVGQSTALSLQALQNQLPAAQAITAAAQMTAQYYATINTLLDQGKTAIEAEAVAAKQYELSVAAASAAVMKQVEALKDQNAMIKAQANGTEKSTAAAIAYKNAIASGADEASAAALATETAHGYTLRAAAAALEWQQNLFGVGAAAQQAAASINAAMDAEEAAYRAAHQLTQGTFAPEVMPTGQLSFSAGTGGGALSQGYYANGGTGKRLSVGFALNNIKAPELGDIANKYVGQGDISGAITAVEAAKTGSVDDKMSLVDSLTQLLNGSTSDKGTQISNLQSELAWLNTLPETIARDQKIVSLQQSIDQLKNSTDGLNSTMGDLLSPYYSQDPRTSHIGFRSQGMATGGEFTVPGGYSANDNMLAQIPVASGEIVSVRRPGQNLGGTTQTVQITNHITVGPGADKNEIGRTIYQATQNSMRQFQAATR
jgi:hypothetical protein